MGITAYTAANIQHIIHKKQIESVIEFGSQNLYLEPSNKPPFADEWYKRNGVKEYHCIDLAGDNNAIRWDLSRPIETKLKYDLVTDIGTSEHVCRIDDIQTVAFHEDYIHSVYPNGAVGFMSIAEGFYNCWLNKHNLCKIFGVIYSENPKTGSWPTHGYSYINKAFYEGLMKFTDYDILHLEEYPAMGNIVDGWNIACSLYKRSNRFPTFDQFQTLPIFDK